MRSTPPAVELTLASGRREQRIVAAMYAVAASLLGAWLAALGSVPALAVWPLAAVLGAWLGLNALRPMVGSLCWDGQWWWHVRHAGAARALHRVDLMMDLGGWLLLRARAGQGPGGLLPGSWCGISRQDAGSSWHGLRLALHQGAAGASVSTASAPDRTSG
jgi:hypothetical protein